MWFRWHRPADLTASMRALEKQPITTAEAAVIAAVEARRTELASCTATVGDAFEALGGTDRLPVAQQSQIASAPAAKALLLHRLARAVAPGTIAELGSAFGISGAYLIAGLHAGGGGRFVTVEAAASRSEIAAETFAAIDYSGVTVELVVGLFDEHLDTMVGANLIYVDGNHYAEPTHTYVNSAIDQCDDDCVIVLDDIAGYSPEMDKLWSSLRRDRRFKATGRIGDLGVLTVGRTPPVLRRGFR